MVLYVSNRNFLLILNITDSVKGVKMSTINFTVCGADVVYELADNAKREELRINGETIVDACGDVGAWGNDYHLAIAGLHGAAKAAATDKYLRKRAETLIISELFSLRVMVKDLQES